MVGSLGVFLRHGAGVLVGVAENLEVVTHATIGGDRPDLDFR